MIRDSAAHTCPGSGPSLQCGTEQLLGAIAAVPCMPKCFWSYSTMATTILLHAGKRPCLPIATPPWCGMGGLGPGMGLLLGYPLTILRVPADCSPHRPHPRQHDSHLTHQPHTALLVSLIPDVQPLSSAPKSHTHHKGHKWGSESETDLADSGSQAPAPPPADGWEALLSFYKPAEKYLQKEKPTASCFKGENLFFCGNRKSESLLITI